MNIPVGCWAAFQGATSSPAWIPNNIDQVVCVGYCCAGSVPENFRSIDCFIAGVRARDQQAAYSVASAFEESAMSERVVSGIFVRYRRDNSFRHVVSNGLVRERMPI